MEIVVSLVVGGLAGFSVATACGVEPHVPRVPPAELVRQMFESVVEKLPRELVENDLLIKIARSWTLLIPVRRLGLVVEDDASRLAFLLLSSGACCLALAALPWGWSRRLVWVPLAIPLTAAASNTMWKRPCLRLLRCSLCRLPRVIRWPRV